jgi:hypothetical protein
LVRLVDIADESFAVNSIQILFILSSIQNRTVYLTTAENEVVP